MLYEVVIVRNPTRAQEDEGALEFVLYGPVLRPAPTQKAAEAATLSRAIKEGAVVMEKESTRVEVLSRPFV